MYLHVFCSYIHGICMFVFVYHSQMVFCAWCSVQANSKISAGCVRLDINLLKPCRIKVAEDPSTDDRKDAAQLEQVRVERGAETRRRRKADRA